MTDKNDKDRDNLQKIREKSEDDFEKNITYISAGALAISMTFIEKIVNMSSAIYFSLLITAWGFLTLTLLANLSSHYLSSFYHAKTTDELDEENPNTIKNIDIRNKRLRSINIGTIGTLILGIIFLIIFLSINLYHMSNENQKNRTTTESQIQDSSNYEKLGRTIGKPKAANSDKTITTNNATKKNSDNKK